MGGKGSGRRRDDTLQILKKLSRKPSMPMSSNRMGLVRWAKSQVSAVTIRDFTPMPI